MVVQWQIMMVCDVEILAGNSVLMMNMVDYDGYDEIDGFDLDIMDWMRKCDEKDVNLMKNVIGKS